MNPNHITSDTSEHTDDATNSRHSYNSGQRYDPQNRQFNEYHRNDRTQNSYHYPQYNYNYPQSYGNYNESYERPFPHNRESHHYQSNNYQSQNARVTQYRRDNAKYQRNREFQSRNRNELHNQGNDRSIREVTAPPSDVSGAAAAQSTQIEENKNDRMSQRGNDSYYNDKSHQRNKKYYRKNENEMMNRKFEPKDDSRERRERQTNYMKLRNTLSVNLKQYDNDESQRVMLDEQLRKGEYECMVCCDEIRIRDGIWSCEHCYNIFHLKCIKKWAQSAAKSETTDNNGWRCPACQSQHQTIPYHYYCFCGKIKDPELNGYSVPHGCGDMCGKKRKDNEKKRYQCPHKCNIQCHPGPCPPCQARVVRECACKKTKITVSCATDDENVICNDICGKILNCSVHKCEKICHFDECSDCDSIKVQTCFCGRENREVKCDAETNAIEFYNCDQKCGKTLTCFNHKCDLLCHFGECHPCPYDSKLVKHCPCGKRELSTLTNYTRKSCTDPIPTCDEICNKELNCGPKNDRHRCKDLCHEGPCQLCPEKSIIRCRCGANSQSIECSQLSNKESDTFLCKKRCKKKRLCGRHKCLNECCTDAQHECDQICGKKLTCGLHTCQELCHFNKCPPCWNVSWDELTCVCGNSVLLPPIACGTKRPECQQLCTRSHLCDHPVTHHCHDSSCPPCTFLVTKECYGNHGERFAIPCYDEGVSCGHPCQKPLSCGMHKCQKVCHLNDCGECSQPCTNKRMECDHICGHKCHVLTYIECPGGKCKIPMKVTCVCGRKSDQMPCFKVNDEATARLPERLLSELRIKSGESINVSDLLKCAVDNKLCRLKCDDVCAVTERNKQLAEALDIKNVDFSPNPGPPNYSENLKDAARTDPNFIADVYDKLTKLVIESKQSKMNFKNYNFPAMSSHNRHLIHELAEFFGCKTHAVDKEPNRSVIVKAPKDKSYLPTVSILEMIKKNEPQTNINPNRITLKYCNLSEPIKEESSKANGKLKERENIDYFDFIGD